MGLTTREKAKIMLGYYNRKASIEERMVGGKTWVKTSHPLWNWEQMEYQFQPKPKEIWVNEYPSAKQVHESRESARVNQVSSLLIRCAHYKEVTGE